MQNDIKEQEKETVKEVKDLSSEEDKLTEANPANANEHKVQPDHGIERTENSQDSQFETKNPELPSNVEVNITDIF